MNDWIIRCYQWACQRLYNEVAWSYDAVSWLVSLGHWSTWRRSALFYLTAPSLTADKLQVLELGFGTGELLVEMAKRRMSAYGLELSPAMHPIVTEKLRRQQLHLPRIRGDAQELPFASESFDAVLATFPASYIVAPATLHEVHRVLRRSEPRTVQLPGMQNHTGRLIIVGLWVAIKPPWLAALLPIFYGQPNAAALAQYQAQLQHAGFRAEWVTHQDGIFSVGVLVACKQ